MAGLSTPEDAALSGFGPHAGAVVIRADVVGNGDEAEVLVRTDDERDEIIHCVRRVDGWYDVGDVGA